MAMIDISQRDYLRGKIVEPAWYRMKIEDVGEAPSKDGGSTNFPVDGTIIRNAENGDEKFAGVPITWNFNSKATGFAIGFLEALGVEVVPGKFDLAAARGMELDVYVDNKEYQGRILNNVPHKYRAAK